MADPERRSRYAQADVRPATYIGFVIAALVPGLALFALWRTADSRAHPPAPAPARAEAAPASAPLTPLLSFRRAPGVLAADGREARLATAMARMADVVGKGSCFAAAVDGHQVADVRSELAVIPASNLKILTAAVALDVLGADFHFTTKVLGPAPNDAGVVEGDLYLVGGGDPVLATSAYPATQEYPPAPATAFEALADALVAAGVVHIEGAVLGDAGRYDDERYVPTWAEGIRVTEAGPYAALMVDDSRLPNGAVAEDPAAGAAETFVQLLAARGVTVGGGSGAAAAPGTVGELASVSSAPLTGVVAEMLLTSDDNTAELLLKEVGLARHQQGTRSAGLQTVREVLQDWAIPMAGYAQVDGSGLDRANALTCDTMVAVLEREGPDGAVGTGLPVAGETGTLAHNFEGNPMQGILRAKTGTLTGVRSLSGFFPNEAGTVTFALIQNEPRVQESAYRVAWQTLSEVLAGYPSGPDRAALAPR